MYEDLKIILWPDPRLKKISKPIAAITEETGQLVAKMFQLMRVSNGVGLAAPQVGENVRLFVANPTGEPGDDRVFINPELFDGDGDDEAEEGCLSLPQINADILRAKAISIRAQDLNGDWFELRSDDFPARVWQHEFDHLNGVLLMDRMNPQDKIATKKRLRELEEDAGKR